ncbi:uncharacterized protein TRIVIDRAFT_70300 [Trichoderma virens Gv29-8]|uniref:Uncharacterized protein n=1 Tax=Hypocrea virens (strain Gv29-8 / FGSC 10586) TaxID=413071 RepID=G9MW49_HYPVG|nr:uncharacterized protein TRIVIDRAFT_70300 [Trichoderma virens Gv29-8]EHK21345.1 hypothetical protein TRIVIDRAFT_70300 [Trichoderma virens Gv29-8]UKZ47116.1 hypothetical protein TrVGV298_001330 [Trichoderma virens]
MAPPLLAHLSWPAPAGNLSSLRQRLRQGRVLSKYFLVVWARSGSAAVGPPPIVVTDGWLLGCNAIRPWYDAAGSNSVACFGAVSKSKQPQGSPLDPAPTGNARGDVFTICLLQSAIFTQPDSTLPSVRCDGPFDSSSCIDGVAAVIWAISALQQEAPVRLAELAPLETMPKKRGARGLASLVTDYTSPVEMYSMEARRLIHIHIHIHWQIPHQKATLLLLASNCPLTLDWGHAVRERGSVPELPLGSIQEALTYEC